MTASPDPHDLERFVEAQDPVIDRVKKELRTGRKRSHWMWYVFPQVEGLGKSQKSERYAISSRAEAQAYLDHPVLGPRLRECTELVNEIDGRSAYDIFGSPDHRKFQSSMTLFASVANHSAPFERALETYYEGERDENTLEFLSE